MSEPMSNHEIEDVLSSIRRLVSEDLRPAPRGDAAPVAAETSDKLLLTPALRVVPEEVEPVPVEDVVARLGAAVAEEEWESPFGDPEVWTGPAVHDDVPTFVHRARDGEKTTDFNEAPMAAFVEVDDVLPEPSSAPSSAPAAGSVRRVTPPPEQGSWADQAEAEVIADLADAAEDEVLSGIHAATDAMVFDEQVLRDLVRDLIREELAGSLGERITRNVRKLVRAEIARALALREFE